MRWSLVLPMALAVWAALPVAATPVRPAGEALPFLEDDYPAALSEARSRKLPIFVEAWAPW